MIKFDVVRRNLAFIVEKLHSFDLQAPSVVRFRCCLEIMADTFESL